VYFVLVSHFTDTSSHLKNLNHFGGMVLVKSSKSLSSDADLCRLVSKMDFVNQQPDAGPVPSDAS